MDFSFKVSFLLNKWWTGSRRKSCLGEQNKDAPEVDPADIRRKSECPLDINDLGRATWGLLHSIAAYYPEHPTQQERNEIEYFFQILAKYYPCSLCAKEFHKDLQEMPPQTESNEKLSLWLCQMHNRVNTKLGKPVYNCETVFERWRDGWKDGSCE